MMARSENGKIGQEELDSALNGADDHNAPNKVTACLRFKDEVSAMSWMLEPKTPPVVNLRTRSVVTFVYYGVGDASGSDLGSTFTCGSEFTYRIEVWGSDDIGQSSNWKEFCNIVSSLEDEAKEGNLCNSEVFMLTDNSTVESCCVRGTSSSPKLLSLVVQLRSLITRFGVKISVFHVSGTRMIAQSTDGVSRGFLGGGVIAGEVMTSFIPIHLSATAHHLPFAEWVKS